MSAAAKSADRRQKGKTIGELDDILFSAPARAGRHARCTVRQGARVQVDASEKLPHVRRRAWMHS